jgi:hypothetical protein
VGSGFTSICFRCLYLFVFSKQTFPTTFKDFRHAKVIYVKKLLFNKTLSQPNFRLDFVKGILQVVKNPNAWLIAGVIAIPNAVLG